MSEHYWSPQNVSNESSAGRSFQRTISAQDTLAEATALLDELNTRDGEDEEDDMEDDSNNKMEVNGSSEGSEVNGNEDSSESSKTLVQDDVGDLDDIDT